MIYTDSDLLTLYDDPDFYDAEFGNRDHELDFYQNVCSAEESVLEVACGTGRITIPLSLSGIPIRGSDISEAMVIRARLNAKKYGSSCMFEVRDARNTVGKYSCIFIATNAFQHFLSYKDAQAFLSACSNALLKGGRLILDLQVPDLGRLVKPKVDEKYNSFTYLEQDVRSTLNGMYNPISQIYSFHMTYRANGEVIKKKSVAMRMYFHQELLSLIESSGFQLIKAWGNYEREPITQAAHKQILVLTPK